jgi:hypothetical protein
VLYWNQNDKKNELIPKKMKALNKLKELLTYYEGSRQSGHTTLMRKGTDHYAERKKFVLAFNAAHGDNMGFKVDEVISWQNLSKLRGHNKPLAIDNGSMLMILRDTISEIEVLEEENRALRGKIDIIRKLVK